MLDRRGFLSGLAAALCAPAIIRTPGLLMPVKAVKGAPFWYCNRTIRVWADVQAIRDRNVLLRLEDYAGNPAFRSFPVRFSDEAVWVAPDGIHVLRRTA